MPSHLTDWIELTQLTSFIDTVGQFQVLELLLFPLCFYFSWFPSYLCHVQKPFQHWMWRGIISKLVLFYFWWKPNNPRWWLTAMVFHSPTFAVLCFDLSPHDLPLIFLFYSTIYYCSVLSWSFPLISHCVLQY